MDFIPADVFYNISRMLKFKELLRISKTCKRFNLLIKVNKKHHKYAVCFEGCRNLEESIIKGHLGCVNKFNRIRPISLNKNEKMFDTKYTHFIRWLFNSKFVNKEDLMLRCLRFGNLKFVKFLNDNGIELKEYFCSSAIKSGNVKLIKYFIDKNLLKYNREMKLIMLKIGTIKSLIFLSKRGYLFKWRDLQNYIEDYNLQSLKYLCDLFCDENFDILCGRENYIEYLHDNVPYS